MILTPYLDDYDVIVYAGDCIQVMAQMPEASIDAVVTDPPYGLGFMGKDWDTGSRMIGHLSTGTEKRGAFAYGGAHDRGYADNDSIAFQAFSEAWAREALRILRPGGHLLAFAGTRTYHRMAAGVEDAGLEVRDCIAWMYGSGFPKSLNLSGEWAGWGTALKPAFEPIVVARKPLAGTVSQNVLEHGTGALNIDAGRIGSTDPERPGRWPANVVLDEDAAELLDTQSGVGSSRAALMPLPKSPGFAGATYGNAGNTEQASVRGHNDTGGASRFYYTAKASRQDRNVGGLADNTHPTVKPTELMRWLVRMVAPPDGIILDPFGGSGSTGLAARAESVRCVLIEREPEYLQIIRDRLAQLSLFSVPDDAVA